MTLAVAATLVVTVHLSVAANTLKDLVAPIKSIPGDTGIMFAIPHFYQP